MADKKNLLQKTYAKNVIYDRTFLTYDNLSVIQYKYFCMERKYLIYDNRGVIS